MKKNTITEVATRAGVSISSVSRYLADKTSIKPFAAVKIAEAIRELNFVPNTFARNLRIGSSNIVGYVQPDISQDLFNQCMKAMNQIFYENDYMLITCDTDNNPEKERKLIQSLIRQNVTSLIVVTCGENSSFLQEVASSYPNLIIANRQENDVVANSFCEDQAVSGYRLAKYMIEKKGCKKFKVIAGVPYSGATTRRVKGFKKAFAEMNIEFSESDIVMGCTDFKTSSSAASKLLEGDSFDCILFTNQRSANGITKTLSNSSIKYAKFVKVGGFTSKKNLEENFNKFPCIMEDTEMIAIELGNFVMNRIKNPQKKIKKITFHPPLVDIESNYIEDFKFL